MTRRWAMAAGLALLVSAPAAAEAKDKLVGAKLVEKIKPASGFVDNPLAFDEAGGRLLYVNASIGGKAELRVLDLAQGGAQIAAVDITEFTKRPERVMFALDGAHYLVIAEEPDKDSDKKVAALVGKKGVVRTFGPATDIRLRTERGKQRVVLYDRTWKSTRKGPQVRHTVELRDPSSGRRVGKARTLVSDEGGTIAKLDFTISHWQDDYTRVVGIKGGKWDRKEDQRTPDREAWYAVDTGTFTKSFAIKDVIAHRKQQKLMREHQNQAVFVTVANDLSDVLVVRDGEPAPVKLTETFGHYDHKSLVMQEPDADGRIFFTLTIDPVHPDAVARRRAVPRYLDLYELAPGSKKARRRARIRLRDKRERDWVATSEHWVVVPGHIGFDRGGKSLQIYKLK